MFLAILALFKLLINLINIIKPYLKSLIRDNKIIIFIKLILKIKDV